MVEKFGFVALAVRSLISEASMSQLREKYRKEVIPKLVEQQGYENTMQVPRLDKIVLSIGLGEATQNPKALEAAEQDLVAISGQHPVITRAKKSISSFRLRPNLYISGVPRDLKRCPAGGDRLGEIEIT